jgi:hypothetical protein
MDSNPKSIPKRRPHRHFTYVEALEVEYIDPDDDLCDQLASLTREHYAHLLCDGIIPGNFEDENIGQLLANALRIWRLPNIDEMTTPLGLEFCTSRNEAPAAVQGDYWDFFKRKFLDLFDEVHSKFFSTPSFPIELEEIFVEQVLNISFKEDIGLIHNSCRKYLRERTEELLDLKVDWVLKKDKKHEFYDDAPSTLPNLVEKYGAEDRPRWESFQTVFKTQDKDRQARLSLWRTTQMFRIFGPRRDKADRYQMTLTEDYDSCPGRKKTTSI